MNHVPVPPIELLSSHAYSAHTEHIIGALPSWTQEIVERVMEPATIRDIDKSPKPLPTPSEYLLSGEVKPVIAYLGGVVSGVESAKSLVETYLADRPQAQMALMYETERAEIQKERFLESDEAKKDPLTGLYNRIKLDEWYGQFQADKQNVGHRRLTESGEDPESSTIHIDLDRFSDVNNKYGHNTGDTVLKVAATTILHNVRESDLVVRLGGEEMLVLLKGASTEQAMRVANTIREAIYNTPVVAEDGSEIRVTASMGVAQLDPTRELKENVGDADRAMYYAKATGRNRVVDFDDVPADFTPKDSKSA